MSRITRLARLVPARSFSLEPLEKRVLLANVPAGFIDQPWGGTITSGSAFAFAPDGRAFVLTQTGTVRVVTPSGTLLSTPALTLSVDSFFERGLLGIAFDPAFDAGAPGADFVYLYYTVPAAQGGPHNRISRFEVVGDVISSASETVLLNLNPLSAGNHNGGGISFGPDGMLYAGVGDNAVGSNSQSLNNLHGKMLRLNPNPASPIPADNPTSFAGIAGSPTGNNRAIWNVGLRNPFTHAFHPTTGELFINDVGQNAWEEVNLGQPGLNYGWPSTEGPFNQATFPNFTQPHYAYQHGTGVQRGRSVIGGAFYVSDAANQFPAHLQGRYFFGDYVNNWIAYIDPVTPPGINAHTNFATGATSIVDLNVGPDGGLYYLQRGSPAGLRRIITDPATAPTISSHPQSQSVSAGQNATFSVAAGGQAPLAYQWQRSDRGGAWSNIGSNSPSYTLSNAQTADNGAQFRVIVSNSFGQAISTPATLTVTQNQPPTGTITQPAPGTMYNAGDTITFSGTATDPEQGTLPASAFSWTIVFHHDDHTHPFLGPIDGVTTGQFTIPTTGHTETDVWYRIELTVTDDGGLQHTSFTDIFPNVVDLGLATSPSGLIVNLDGQPRTTPFVTGSVVGVVRTLEAPSNQFFSGQWYQFVSWSNGQPRVHEIATPPANTTYAAAYVVDTIPPQVSAADFVFDGHTLPDPPHRLQVAFSENVIASLSTADLVLTNLTTGQVVPAGSLAMGWDALTNTATFTFPGFTNGILPDGNWQAEVVGAGIQDPAGNVMSGSFVQDFFVLAGDANRDRRVNAFDLAILRANFSQSGKTFSQGDFNYDGVVNALDLAILRGRFGVYLPPPDGGRLFGGGGGGGDDDGVLD